jgi:hypothetical protein
VNVNGKPVGISGNGSFSATVSTGSGSGQQVVVSASEKSTGQTYTIRIPAAAIGAGGETADALAQLDNDQVTLLIPEDGLVSVDGNPSDAQVQAKATTGIAQLSLNGSNLLPQLKGSAGTSSGGPGSGSAAPPPARPPVPPPSGTPPAAAPVAQCDGPGNGEERQADRQGHERRLADDDGHGQARAIRDQGRAPHVRVRVRGTWDPHHRCPVQDQRRRTHASGERHGHRSRPAELPRP